MVCWDQWYPEGARMMALAGAELLLYPTAIGWDPEDEQPRRIASATPGSSATAAMPWPTACQCCRATALGTNPRRWAPSGIQFWGSTHVLGPQGEFLAEANQNEPEILMCEVDMERSEHVRRIWPFPARPSHRCLRRSAEALSRLIWI
jgi:N-carbamoylputrescine amidase